jgi:hypothetical protein
MTSTVGPDVRHVWVEPTPLLLNEGISKWETAANIMPSTIPAYWMNKKNIISDVGTLPRLGEKVVYSLHGGAYIRPSTSPHDLPANWTGVCSSIVCVFAIEYRPSKHIPDEFSHPFSWLCLTPSDWGWRTSFLKVTPLEVISPRLRALFSRDHRPHHGVARAAHGSLAALTVCKSE